MTFVIGRFKPADLLLRSLQAPCEFLLRKSRLLAQRGDLQRHVPCLTGTLEPCGKARVLHLLREIAVEIRRLHGFVLSCQSRIRSFAVRKSRSGMAWPLLRIPCTAMIRRFFMKNHNTRVLSLPTWRNSNSPPPSALDKGSRGYCRCRSFASPATTAAKSSGSLAFNS